MDHPPEQPPSSSAAPHGATSALSHPRGRYVLRMHRLSLKEFWRASENVLSFLLGVFLLKVLRLSSSPAAYFDFPPEPVTSPLPEWVALLFAGPEAVLRGEHFEVVQRSIALLQASTPTYARTYLSEDKTAFAQLMVGDDPAGRRAVALTLSSGRGRERLVTTNAPVLLTHAHDFTVNHIDAKAGAAALIDAHRAAPRRPSAPLTLVEVSDIVLADNQRELAAMISRGLYVLDADLPTSSTPAIE